MLVSTLEAPELQTSLLLAHHITVDDFMRYPKRGISNIHHETFVNRESYGLH